MPQEPFGLLHLGGHQPPEGVVGAPGGEVPPEVLGDFPVAADFVAQLEATRDVVIRLALPGGFEVSDLVEKIGREQTAFDAEGRIVAVRRWDSPGLLSGGTELPFTLYLYSLGGPIERVDLLVEAPAQAEAPDED